MAFTGQLGAQQATPGNIQLGITTAATAAVLLSLRPGLTSTRQTPAVTSPLQTTGRASPQQKVANA